MTAFYAERIIVDLSFVFSPKAIKIYAEGEFTFLNDE